MPYPYNLIFSVSGTDIIMSTTVDDITKIGTYYLNVVGYVTGYQFYYATLRSPLTV